ncbi:MAG: DUF72 domain-containing protein [Synechococcales cyanobacterium RM1_1_8]|nr:DUF72 domain-containing protein [Synechococcales cyanobacterium RM1_1_8]
MSNFYLGCAVWAHRDWLGDFYPKGSQSGDFLQLYGDRLTAVEGNTTFYSIPDEPTVARWAAQTPDSFRFCLKLPRLYSHDGPLVPQIQGSHDFLSRMQPLGPRRGPLFIQLPPSYSPNMRADLLGFLDAWPAADDPLHMPLALELRHRGWFIPSLAADINQALQARGMGRVLLDTRLMYEGPDDPQALSQRQKPNLPLQPDVTAPFTLVRFITHPEPLRNQAYLQEWAERVVDWLAAGIQVYFFVHCPMEARSPATTRSFQRLVERRGRQRGVEIPPLPWDQVQEPPAQLSLF